MCVCLCVCVDLNQPPKVSHPLCVTHFMRRTNCALCPKQIRVPMGIKTALFFRGGGVSSIIKTIKKRKKKPHLLNYKSFHIKLQLYTIKSVAKSNTQLHHSAPHVSHFGDTVCVGASQTSRAHISLMNQRPYRSQHRQPTISQHQSTV